MILLTMQQQQISSINSDLFFSTKDEAIHEVNWTNTVMVTMTNQISACVLGGEK